MREIAASKKKKDKDLMKKERWRQELLYSDPIFFRPLKARRKKAYLQ